MSYELGETSESDLRESLEKLKKENRIFKLDIKGLKHNRDELSEENEKLEKIVAKIERELNLERRNTETYRQLNLELNRKVEEFENRKNPSDSENIIFELEQETRIKIPKLTLEQSNSKITEKDELSEMMANSGDNETYKMKVEQLTKDNSELENEIQILKGKNEIYIHEHMKINSELEKSNQENMELKENFEKILSEAENKSGNEIRELVQKYHTQEMELKTLKDQTQLFTKQNEELKTTNKQVKHELTVRDSEMAELRKQIEINNRQVREEIENKLKKLNEELEQQKSDYDYLNHTLQNARKKLEGKENEFEMITMESTKDKGNMQEKFFKMEREKQDLQEQIDGLHNLVITLKDESAKMKFKFDASEKEKNKLIKQLTDERIETVESAKRQKEEDRNKIEQLENELKGERESLVISKQLIGKLNDDIRFNTTDQSVTQLRDELEQSNKYTTHLEQKLEIMITEIADRDLKINELVKEQPKMGVSMVSADKPLGAEGGSPIKPIPNPVGKSAIKLTYRGEKVHVLRLKALPDPTTHIKKQIICTIKKNYELGTLVKIFEVPTKVGKKTQMAKFVGVRLNEPLGNSDGVFQGRQVFTCEPNHGHFSPFEDVYVPVI